MHSPLITTLPTRTNQPSSTNAKACAPNLRPFNRLARSRVSQSETSGIDGLTTLDISNCHGHLRPTPDASLSPSCSLTPLCTHSRSPFLALLPSLPPSGQAQPVPGQGGPHHRGVSRLDLHVRARQVRKKGWGEWAGCVNL